MLVFSSESLETLGSTNFDFQGYIDYSKSTSGYMFTINRGALCWGSVK